MFDFKKINITIAVAILILIYVMIRLAMKSSIFRWQEGATTMEQTAEKKSSEKTFSLMEQGKTPELLSPEAIQTKHDDMVKLVDSFENDRVALLDFIKKNKDSIVAMHANKSESVQNLFMENVPNDLKPRVLKLALADDDLKRIITGDSYFNRYLSHYLLTNPLITKNVKTADITDANNLPLKEYFIKGSYDSTFNGMNPSIDELKQQIFNGYRFIDLNIFAIKPDGGEEYNLYVGQSNDGNTPSIDTTLPLVTALKYINEYAFLRDNAMQDDKHDKLPSVFTNYADYPMFVMLRINRQRDSNIDIVKMIYDNYFKQDKEGKETFSAKRLFTNGGYAVPVTGEMGLANIRGKLIFCMDIENILNVYTTTLDAKDVAEPTKEFMRLFVNVKTGGDTWRSVYGDENISKLKRNELLVSMDTGKATNALFWNIAFPTKNTANQDALENARFYQIQLTLMKRYKKDSNLENYENTFSYFKQPMVPMSQVIRFKNLVDKGELQK